MAKKVAVNILFILFFIITPFFAAGSQFVSVSELIEKINFYDGQTVIFRGEAIGDRMARNGVWVNISDSPNSAIGVWLTPADAQKIITLGGYTAKGDIVEVSGVFHRACSAHLGEIDLHATTCRVIQRGTFIEHLVSATRIRTGVVFSFLAVVLMVIWRCKSRQITG